MKIEKLKKEHLEPLRILRNKSRQWFFNKDLITADQQQQWYEAVQKNRKIKFYVVKIKDEIAGAVSMTKTKEGIELGNVILDEKYRGKGVMTKAIQKLTKNKDEKFYARILLENDKSQNLFARCGFVRTAYVMEFKP